MGSCEQAILDLRQIFLHKELSHQELKRTQKCDMNPLLYVKLAFQSFFFLHFIQADTQILQNPQNKSALYLSPQDSYYGVRIKLRTLGFRGKH